MTDELAAGIDRLVDLSPGPADLVAHGLEFFAARRWRALGRPVPEQLVQAELRHAFVDHATASVLTRVRKAADADVLVVKGPAAARLYDDPLVRPYHDLDLVVADPARLQASLVADGFTETGEEPPGGHHLTPLVVPGVPLVLEVHGHPKWLRGAVPPSFERLLRSAQPFERIAGVVTLPPAEHAVLLAVHVWAHDPLTRLLRLIDVACARRIADAGEIAAVVREWRLERLWRATNRVVDAVLLQTARCPAPVRIWGRGLPAAREIAVWESYLGRLLGPFVVLPPTRAARATAAEVAWLLRPEPGESTATRLRRIALHLRGARRGRSEVQRRDEGPRAGD